jgi:hypothetical protein
MDCPEYLRLRQEYEAAIKRWFRVMLYDEGAVHAATSEIRQKADEERDEAKLKLSQHTESCPTCFKDRWKTFDTLRKR